MSTYIKIYHNPACATSRNTLALIRNSGQEPEIIEYLKTPPSKQELIHLIHMSGLTVMDAIRKNVEPYQQLGINNQHFSEDQLIHLMLDYPILINRPFVITELGIKLCRPSESVLDILPDPQQHAFSKEDGELIIDHNLNRLK
ncbi:arsenate reductase (glutaredoxin) [Acinetobacter sp. ANC 4558]|uniref:arsenate reductase (glutaredoxin) n=1 Tax=Acinetobacter sp. ANC 4558 TaxID=1977876 RepID=UPI000A34633F|nr:arsenate reductase (glutaredoxin) [Acinetobacter sp. ANC 4558]OTG83187.1 arsenate reductase (glutaredoxin) [Acinetobacter sp. ANC 4558]